MTQYWLMKTEPTVYSIDDLKREKISKWEGIRNYQARNYIRDGIKKGDRVLIYHSNAKPIGIAGTAVVVREAYPDFTALDPKSPYYFAKATEEKNPWVMVDVKFESKCKEIITRDELKATKGLDKMVVLQKGRLSVQPVTKMEYQIITSTFPFSKK